MIFILFLDQTFDYMYCLQKSLPTRKIGVVCYYIKEKINVENRNGLQITHITKRKQIK